MKLIMVGLIIVGLAFSAYLIISTDRSTDLDPVDAAFTTETGDGDTFELIYVKGDLLNMSRVAITFTIDGERFRIEGPDAGLGTTWTAGESVCAVGPDCIRPSATKVQAEVSYDGLILHRSQERTLR